MRGGWAYIVTNRPNGSLTLGVAADIGRRASEHRKASSKGSRRYGLKRLVRKEFHGYPRCDSEREQHQALAPRLEGEADSRRKPRMARPLRGTELVRLEAPSGALVDGRVKPGHDGVRRFFDLEFPSRKRLRATA
jgi:putative endonuclease